MTSLEFLQEDDSAEAEEIRNFIKDKERELLFEFQKHALENLTPSTIKGFIRYGKPLLINFEKIRDPANTFVLPLFIKPGRIHFFLRTEADPRVQRKVEKGSKALRMLTYQNREDAHFRFYYNRHIVANREEKVPGCKYFSKLLNSFYVLSSQAASVEG